MRDNDWTSRYRNWIIGREGNVIFIQRHPYVQKVGSKSESREIVSSPPPSVDPSFFNSRSPCRRDDNTREIRPRFANFVLAKSNVRLRSLALAHLRPPPSVPSVFLYADCRQLLAIVRRKARETELRRVRTSGRPDGYHPQRATATGDIDR